MPRKISFIHRSWHSNVNLNSSRKKFSVSFSLSLSFYLLLLFLVDKDIDSGISFNECRLLILRVIDSFNHCVTNDHFSSTYFMSKNRFPSHCSRFLILRQAYPSKPVGEVGIRSGFKWTGISGHDAHRIDFWSWFIHRKLATSRCDNTVTNSFINSFTCLYFLSGKINILRFRKSYKIDAVRIGRHLSDDK